MLSTRGGTVETYELLLLCTVFISSCIYLPYDSSFSFPIHVSHSLFVGFIGIINFIRPRRLYIYYTHIDVIKEESGIPWWLRDQFCHGTRSVRLRYEFTVRRRISLLFFTIYFPRPPSSWHLRCPAPWAKRILVRPAFFLHHHHVLYTLYTYTENTIIIIIFRFTFSCTKPREKSVLIIVGVGVYVVGGYVFQKAFNLKRAKKNYL